MVIKSPEAFRTISEVSKDLSLPQHVLRFWETKFAQIKPIKRGGGRRYYRPEDVDLLKGIKNLLYNDGYTIRGVQKVIKENGSKNVLFSNNKANTKLSQKAFTDSENSYISEQNVHTRTGQSLSDNKRKKLMDKKSTVKIRLVPEEKTDSKFYYYAKKPTAGEKAKEKLRMKKYNPATMKHEWFVEKKLPPHSK